MKAGKSMQELSESSELKTFFDRRLIKALSHPVREHILAVLNERVASASEIGEELGADVSSFYHHIEELEKLDCIELVETRQRRGAKEHFFRAKQSLFFDDEAWRRMPKSLKADVTASSLQLLFDDVLGALSAGTLEARDDRHVSWTPGIFDARGWDDVKDLMHRTLDRLGEIQGAAAERLAKGAPPEVSATVAVLAYETGKLEASRASEQARVPARAPHRSLARLASP
jgi:DNA-binding transcriptional ArsR family regulator